MKFINLLTWDSKGLKVPNICAFNNFQVPERKYTYTQVYNTISQQSIILLKNQIIIFFNLKDKTSIDNAPVHCLQGHDKIYYSVHEGM